MALPVSSRGLIAPSGVFQSAFVTFWSRSVLVQVQSCNFGLWSATEIVCAPAACRANYYAGWSSYVLTETTGSIAVRCLLRTMEGRRSVYAVRSRKQ